MGYFGYSFINLTPEQLHVRRIALDHYALIAQLSSIAVLTSLQCVFLALWVRRRFSKNDEESRPTSPYLKAELELENGLLKNKVVKFGRKAKWWMGDEVLVGWGKKGEWIMGGAWLSWLLSLCVIGTGADYMHLTKRFGIVAASQLPLHYLLAMKHAYSPLQILTRMSHEQLNSIHQILGRIIQILLTLHATFYLNFFIRINVLAKRVRDRDVILGLVCIVLIQIISTAGLAKVRSWNYRLFYVIHVVGATLFLPLAYFHVHHIRIFILESAPIYLLHVFLRALQTRRHTATVAMVTGTNLVHIKAPLLGTSSRAQFKPAQHVYLTIPTECQKSRVPSMFLHNPFTVASLPGKDGQITLVARALNGTTKALSRVARSSELEGENEQRSLTVKLEGPYGMSPYFPDFSTFDRVLLVAGGVGATFIVPLWRNLISAKRTSQILLRTDVRLVWAVRKLSETSWALPLHDKSPSKDLSSSKAEAEVYVTGSANAPLDSLESASRDTIELAETATLVGDHDEKTLLEQGIATQRHRPDLREIVDETFNGTVGSVAVLVCGPYGMGRQLRREVGRYAKKGKNIFWHAEEFGL